MRAILSLFLLSIAPVSFAATAPQHSLIWDRAQSLQPGESYFSITTSYQSGRESFNSSGGTTKLGQASSGERSWAEVMGRLPVDDRQKLKGFMEGEGLSQGSFAYTEAYELNQRRTQVTPLWAYGLTRRWMVMARLPMTFTKTTVKYEMKGTENYKKFMMQSGRSGKMTGFSPQAASGSTEETQSETGNFELQSKYQFLNRQDFRFSVSQSLLFATAEKVKSDEVRELYTESSQQGAGFGSHMDWRATSKLWVHGAMSFLWNFNERSRETNLKGERKTVRVEVGDISKAQLIGEYSLFKSWWANGGFLYQDKRPDQIENRLDGFSAKRWELLKLGMAYRKNQSFSTLGRRNITAELNYYSPIGGRSVLDAATTSLELTMVF